MTDTISKENLIRSAAWYLKNHDYEILDTEWSCNHKVADIVATEDNCLVFVKVKQVETPDDYAKLETPEFKKKLRHEFETVALAYLVVHTDITSMPMRCDVIGVCRIDKDRCLVRQQTNAVGIA